MDGIIERLRVAKTLRKNVKNAMGRKRRTQKTPSSSSPEKTSSPISIKGSKEIEEEMISLSPLPKKVPSKTPDALEKLRVFQKEGLKILAQSSEQEIVDMLDYANKAYRNEQPVISDQEYDVIENYMKETYPKNQVLQQIGAPVDAKVKVKLPYNMPSMDKIKPDTDALEKWVSKYKGPYVLSCKLDGVSGLYTSDKLYTRGDGTEGQDISYLIPSLQLPKHSDYVVRGEFIISKNVFAEKYSSSYANIRNMVAGITNKKGIDERAKDIDFVAYEIIEPQLPPSEQMKILQKLGHKVVRNISSSSLSNEQLSALLIDWRTNYEYEIDGIIVSDDNIHPRTKGNPEYAFAFKMVLSDQQAESTVVDVEWTASKDGYLKPVVIIEPVQLGGVSIQRLTGFNGKFIQDKKIGVGAVIQFVRSGDVIPYIKSVSIPATITKMPTVPYVWTESGVDIILEDLSKDPTVQIKTMVSFFKHLKVDGLQEGNVTKIHSAGFTTIPKVISMTYEDFLRVEGFKEKTATKLFEGIRDKIYSASALDLAIASGRFGRGLGEKKLGLIVEAFPSVFSSQLTVKEIQSVKGIGKENATDFVEGLPKFIEFLNECGLSGKLDQSAQPIKMPEPVIDHPLYKKNVVMSKIRDKEIIAALEKYGASLGDSIKTDTLALIVANKEDVSTKIKDAIKKNVPIMTPDEFKEKYL